MSIGYPSTYISATEDLDPSVTFKFSNLSKVARIVFYNRSDSNQDRILAYKMRCVYDKGSAINNSVFSFTAELIQTFNTTTGLTGDSTGLTANVGGSGNSILLFILKGVGFLIFISSMSILYLKKYGRWYS